MNKKAIMWGDVKDILIMMALIALILWVISSMVAKPASKLTDCEKNQGYCSPICGAGTYQMLQYKCDAKADVCCYDELALKGESPPELTLPEGLDTMSCASVNSEIDFAQKNIWQKMAINNPGNSTCRSISNSDFARNPCTPTTPRPNPDYTTCSYKDNKVADCTILAKIITQKETSCATATNS